METSSTTDLIQSWQTGHPGSAAWLGGRRAAGAARLATLGLPTTQLEPWRYTSLKRLGGVAFEHHTEVGVDQAALAALRLAGAAAELVVVNGRVRPELSRIAGVVGLAVGPLADADEALVSLFGGSLTAEDGLGALHDALVQEGWWVKVARGAVAGPVHLLHVMTGAAGPAVASPQHLILAEANADLQVLETHAAIGGADTLSTASVEIRVGPGARVRQQVIVHGAAEGRRSALHRTAARIERDATWHRHVVVLGGALVRDDVHGTLAGPGGTCLLDGLLLAGRGEHIDTPTRVEHAAPSCMTRERYKGVIGAGGRGVFDGTVVVHEGARGTDAIQSNHNLLLADDADINTKPRLEIYNDDVKCAHGTTVGQLDRQQLAYLRMRGIPEGEARAMLTHAFVTDVCEAAPVAPAQALVEAKLAALLGEVA
jgi:Fe-S cluster assembly protein SufD